MSLIKNKLLEIITPFIKESLTTEKSGKNGALGILVRVAVVLSVLGMALGAISENLEYIIKVKERASVLFRVEDTDPPLDTDTTSDKTGDADSTSEKELNVLENRVEFLLDRNRDLSIKLSDIQTKLEDCRENLSDPVCNGDYEKEGKNDDMWESLDDLHL